VSFVLKFCEPMLLEKFSRPSKFVMTIHLRVHYLVVISSFLGCSVSNPLGSWNPQANASIFGSQAEHFTLRDDVAFDQTDLSFITSLAAIGDSYSAGIGAGDRLGDATQFLDKQSGNHLPSSFIRCKTDGFPP
jgi:hypothetical protein